tara:strand:- start:883 stop:1074 length:192 start_codon:yes stop_codon:yes gene_type:complete
MAKYSRFDPRNKNKGRNKYRSLSKDVRIRGAEDCKDVHKYKGTQLEWVIVDEVVEDTDEPVSS